MCLMTRFVNAKKKKKKKKNDSGLEPIENAPKPGKPKSASCDEIVSKVKPKCKTKMLKEILDTTVSDNIAGIVGISLSRVHYILKNILNVKNVSTRWVPHFLTDDQRKRRVKIANNCLK